MKICSCDVSNCAKCLASNCVNVNCLTHTVRNKALTKERILKNLNVVKKKVDDLLSARVTPAELENNYNSKRMSRIEEEIKALKKDLERLNKLQEKQSKTTLN